MPTDDFDLRAVEQAIANTQFAGRVAHLASVTSTNTLALEAAQSGARHGVWIADEQTAGRGRGSHTWHSTAGTRLEPDGLYLSALISPKIDVERALRLSMAVAIAVQSAIVSVAGFRRRDQIDIRWPNDLLLAGKDGIARKCGGILIDTASGPAASDPAASDPAASGPAAPNRPATLRYAIVGIGINLNHLVFPPELDSIATSLRRELPDPSQPLRREPLAAAILIALDREMRRLASDLEPRIEDISQFSSWIEGKRVRVEARGDGCGGYTGTTAGLDRHGFLRVHGDDGQVHTVLTGGLREP